MLPHVSVWGNGQNLTGFMPCAWQGPAGVSPGPVLVWVWARVLVWEGMGRAGGTVTCAVPRGAHSRDDLAASQPDHMVDGVPALAALLGVGTV